MSSPLAYLTGQFRPASDCSIAIADAGFVSGASVVDNARTFGGKLFRWNEHLDRFRRHCIQCRVPLQPDDAELTRIVEELLAHNLPLDPLGELHVVSVATPGPPGGPPTLLMTTTPVRIERYRSFFTNGAELVVAGTQSANATDLLPPAIKHRSRLHWHIAEQRIRTNHTDAVPVVMNHGVGDTAIAAIAAVMTDGSLRIPPLERVQESISVKVLTELGVPSKVGEFSWWSAEVQELLLAGTGFGLAGVRLIQDGDRMRSWEWPGPVYRKLLTRLSLLAGLDIEAQFASGIPKPYPRSS